MKIALKILGSLGYFKNILTFLNSLLNGKKTYLAGAIIILPALSCLLKMFVDADKITLDLLWAVIHSDCVKQIGEGLAVIGFRSGLSKTIKP